MVTHLNPILTGAFNRFIIFYKMLLILLRHVYESTFDLGIAFSFDAKNLAIIASLHCREAFGFKIHPISSIITFFPKKPLSQITCMNPFAFAVSVVIQRSLWLFEVLFGQLEYSELALGFIESSLCKGPFTPADSRQMLSVCNGLFW